MGELLRTSDRLLRWLGHHSWLPWRLRVRLVRWLRHPDRTPAIPFEVEFFGLRYAGALNVLIDAHVFFFGAYAEYELRLLRTLLELRGPGSVFVDVGANVGHHSLYMSRFATTVHSFEPWPVVADRIREKIRMNALKSIQLHPVGLGTEAASLDFFAAEKGNTGTGSFSNEHAAGRNRPVGKMRIEQGDEYFQRAGIERIDLVKIDVEGWEPHVLRGLRETIIRTRPIIFMEYSETTARSLEGERLLDWLPPDYVALNAVIGGREFSLARVEAPAVDSELVLLAHADYAKLSEAMKA